MWYDPQGTHKWQNPRQKNNVISPICARSASFSGNLIFILLYARFDSLPGRNVQFPRHLPEPGQRHDLMGRSVPLVEILANLGHHLHSLQDIDDVVDSAALRAHLLGQIIQWNFTLLLKFQEEKKKFWICARHAYRTFQKLTFGATSRGNLEMNLSHKSPRDLSFREAFAGPPLEVRLVLLELPGVGVLQDNAVEKKKSESCRSRTENVNFRAFFVKILFFFVK